MNLRAAVISNGAFLRFLLDLHVFGPRGRVGCYNAGGAISDTSLAFKLVVGSDTLELSFLALFAG